MTPRTDTPKQGRPDKQAAMLARLREKGLGLAPHVEGGRIVRSKGSGKQPAVGGRVALSGPSDPPDGSLVHPAKTSPPASAIPGSVFELWIPAPGKFLSLNDRMHHHPKARLIKAWRAAAADAAEIAGLPRGLARVHVGIDVVKTTNRGYDVHNLMPTAKAAIDGIVVDYGLVADDSNEFLTGPDMRPGGTGPAGLRVIIRAVAS